ncbi:iron ABC transporter permease [Pseudodesulfovibrio sp. zrk46]|uniref:ABC transporter permease n=1 Tax=Pseudodesulfovibrio sp. zrk46 TaxID=2725288 RepID=UPI001449F128|nr:iron ABC transporter permease [Pseudodesulfovibrio sp. zrk46]QJB55934.1 iron ABC transporter permease [Pseudodesulfovibrio sp. zrk46]
MSESLKVHTAGETLSPPRRRLFRLQSPGWFAGAALLALVASVPLLVIVGHLLIPQQDVWQHLAENVLATLVANTALLLLCIVPLTAVMGVGLGWLTGACDYPGRKFFAWALVLPFAVPPYVFAFVYLGLFDFSGPVQTALRAAFPSMGFIDIRNVVGVASILSLAFYPYVYLMARSAFMTQGRTAMEAARTLGMKPSRAFFKVALPMARPFIAAGLVLVCMESLADFGAVSIFNYDTFTNAIYKAWFGLFSLESAAQLSSVLAIFVLIALVMEQRMRARMRFTEAGRSSQAERLKLTGFGKWAAFAASLLVFMLAFAVPCIQLAFWAWEVVGPDAVRYVSYSVKTLSLGLTGAAATTLCAMVLAFAKRNDPGHVMTWTSRIATLGYALPGTVLAVGIFIPASWLDAALIHLVSGVTDGKVSPIIQGSLGLMIVAYVVRFMAAAFGSVDSAMQRITPSIGEAARTMGVSGLALLRRIYLPMLNKGLMAGAILVLVDVMKEMPITLMMRPFGWDTLAVKIFEYTSEGEWELAAIPAVVLILVGLVPVLLLTRQSEK